LPTVPEPLRGSAFVAVRGCYCGDPAAGQAFIDQARAELGPAELDTFAVMPTADLATVSLDPPLPVGAMNHTELLADLTPETIDVLVELAGPDSHSPLVMLELRQLGGALAGPMGALSPMAHTEAAYSLNAVGVTPTPEHAAAVRTHLDLLAERVRPFVTGEVYLNFLDLDGATPDRVRAAYSPNDWDRLTRLKGHYDPRNLFRFNRTIPRWPTGQ